METKLLSPIHDVKAPLLLPAIQRCVSCGEPMGEKFCGSCGEKKVDTHEFSIKHFLEELVEGVTHFDGKFFRTIKLLFLKPGQLPTDFIQGRRVAYMKPLQFFVVCNLLFFLLNGKSNIFATSLFSFYQYDPYISFGSKEVIDQILAKGISIEILASIFNDKMASQSKMFILYFIPVITLASVLCFANKKKYLFEHLIFATYVFSFMLLFFTISRWLIGMPVVILFKVDGTPGFDLYYSLFQATAIVTYFVLAAKHFFQVSYGRALAGGMLVSVLLMLGLQSYRILLFYKIIYSISI